MKLKERITSEISPAQFSRKPSTAGSALLIKTSKSSSSLEEPDNRILRGYCGAKELSNLGPLHTEPKAHVEEEEAPED